MAVASSDICSRKLKIVFVIIGRTTAARAFRFHRAFCSARLWEGPQEIVLRTRLGPNVVFVVLDLGYTTRLMLGATAAATASPHHTKPVAEGPGTALRRTKPCLPRTLSHELLADVSARPPRRRSPQSTCPPSHCRHPRSTLKSWNLRRKLAVTCPNF